MNTLTSPAAVTDLSSKNLSEIAGVIRKDWKIPNYAAKPYLDALGSLENISDNYFADTGSSVVAYFLANAAQWKGETAKAVKKELNKRLKASYK